ncbi:hypothetical protein ACO1O0_002047 [Amphichorda felina]
MKPAALAFLEASPPWTNPREITEIEGYEIRREFAREVMNELNHPDDSGERPLDNNYWKMTVTMFSAIMVAPIDDLRGIRDSIQYCTQREKLDKLLAREPGCSDYSWNMISLSPTLHALWSKGLWGFEYKGRTKSKGKWQVSIQFHWMPQDPNWKLDPKAMTKSQPLHPKDVVDWEKNYLDKLKTPVPNVGANDITTNHPILTGHTFTIPFTTVEEAEKFKSMIELQWAVIRVSALSGAAGNPDLFDWDDDDDPNPAIASSLRDAREFDIASSPWEEEHADVGFGADDDDENTGVERE